MTNDRATFSLITSRNIDSNIGIMYITITYNILLKTKQNKIKPEYVLSSRYDHRNVKHPIV